MTKTLRVLTVGLATLATAVVVPPGCNEDPYVLPSQYNTGRWRELTFEFTQKKEGETQFVVPLNGMVGSPKAIIPGGPDLTFNMWGRTSNSPDGPDGAHVRIARVGTDTLCDLSMEGIFPDNSRDPNDPASYDFSVLDSHIKAIDDLNTARIMWQAAFKPGGSCSANNGVQQGTPIASQAEADLFATVAFNTLRHLRSPGTNGEWDPLYKGYNVSVFEFADDPVEEMGYPSTSGDPAWDRLFSTFAQVSRSIKEEWPDQQDDEGNPAPRVYVGGMSFSFTSPTDLDFTGGSANRPPIFAFIDYCKNNDVPLDYISFKTKTATPQESFQIAEKIKDYLADKQMPNVKLTLTGFEPDYASPVYADAQVLDDPLFMSAHLGAFQTAVRILGQDVPLTWALAGRAPSIYGSLAASGNEGQIVQSSYFDSLGTAQPAYMALFPFRQVPGHQRFSVNLAESDTDDGFVLMGSHPTSSDDTIHIIIANSNIGTGNASVTYDLRIKTWVLPQVQNVRYRLATLDRNAVGSSSFFFSETGTIETTDNAGWVRFVHEMAIPSVHYLTFQIGQVCALGETCN